MFTTYDDSPLAVIMLHTTTILTLTLRFPNRATSNKKHDVVHFSGRPLVCVPLRSVDVYKELYEYTQTTFCLVDR